jgi:2-polyprenyl-3-methyl-5-hydroxy-6-metoxy-1,4-benzoquinol methylase
VRSFRPVSSNQQEEQSVVTRDAETNARLIDEVREIWDAKAAFWDERMGDGNQFQRELIGPAVERLVAVQPGERVLDVGCGNGVSTRRLAELGGRITGIDYSERFIELARARTTPFDERIDYRVIDATDEAQLLALGEGEYDALVCNMVIMDMPVIDPLLRCARRLLKPQGRFVFSLQHPAFNSNAVNICGERDQGDVTRQWVKISNYLDVPAGRGAGMPGEPLSHWYFHRPLHELFGAFFAAGFVIDGLEEPRFATQPEDPHKLAWSNMPGIPPVLVVRAVPRSSAQG